MSAQIVQMWDGDTYPVIRVEMKDSGAARDLTNCATWIDVWKDGAFLVRRPGRILTPKTAGLAEYFLGGRETDWAGVGGRLSLYPVLMVPYTAGGDIALNLLTNGGLDTFTGAAPSKLPTSWTLVGAQSTETFDGYCNDSKPPCLFEGGNFWLAQPGTTAVTHLEQSVTQNTVPGDYVTFGCWVRGTSQVAVTPGDDTAIEVFSSGGADDVKTRFNATEFDWKFLTADQLTTVAHTSVGARLRYKGFNPGSLRFDESCLFVGRYKRLSMRSIPVVISPTAQPAKTTNQIAGIGAFDRDSDSDGFPDGWMHTAAFSGVTPSIEQNPVNVYVSGKSLKLVLAASSTGARIFTIRRGRFLNGETWRFTLRAQCTGLSASASISIAATPFTNGASVRQFGASTSIGTTITFSTLYIADLTLTSDYDSLECRILIGDITGTLWLDDAQFYRV